jgi:hypothetical protein
MMLAATFRSSTSSCGTGSTKQGGVVAEHQQSLFGKMSLESSQQKTTPSGVSSEDCLGAMTPLKLKTASGLKQAFCVQKPSEWVGESLTPNTLPWLNGVGESFSLPCLVNLSQVLEVADVHPRYFLSAKACSGILRRAERRGKELPEQLRLALAATADHQTTT